MAWGQASLPLDHGLPPGGRGGGAPHTHAWTHHLACPNCSHICANSHPKDTLGPQGIQMGGVVREQTHGRISCKSMESGLGEGILGSKMTQNVI